jgi:hypothetical protein
MPPHSTQLVIEYDECDHELSGSISPLTSSALHTASPYKPLSDQKPCRRPIGKFSASSPSLRINLTSRKAVTFQDCVKVIPIERVASSFTRQEIEQIWFTRLELQRIRKRCFQTLEKMNSGQEVSEAKGFCSRGLEQHRQDKTAMRSRIKRCANEAVFGMQKFQKFKGLALPELMADLYQSSAAESLRMAYDLAKLAEADALSADV